MNPSDKKPDNFDWVTARHKCSAFMLFEKLKLLVSEDVELRNSIRVKNTGEPYFKLLDTGRSAFSVTAEQMERQIHLSVMFNWRGNEITVASGQGVIFKATVTLNNDGDCKPQIDGKEYDLWQLRKMALEGLFFRNWQET
jgi:hypothetical protein